jgi:uncharacterized protein (DUF58 family)
MSATAVRPFPLIPKRRFAGVQFGRRRSSRRGDGDEIAGTRPYRPGDLTARIHWPASARLSEARGMDEFVVREFFAEQAPRVALVVDRRPAMAINAPPSPWLDKRGAVESVVRLVQASAAAEHGELAYADATLRRPVWLRGTKRLEGAYAAGESALRLPLESLCRNAALLPTGSFVFVISDFLPPVPPRVWLRLRAQRWDVTPVVVQDPVWEQTFPRAGGVTLPVVDPATGRIQDVWLSPRAARERAAANERRLDGTLGRFRRLGFDPVVIDTNDEREISARFNAWADRRKRLLRVSG